jgi:hypothetical protein
MKSQNHNSGKKVKKVKFEKSENIMQLDVFHAAKAQELAAKLRTSVEESVFIEIDCAPNGSLNAFNYSNGLNSVKIMKEIGLSLLRNELPALERKIKAAKNSAFQTDFALGEIIGLWKRITIDNYSEQLDWDQPFCLKNEKGLTKIWHPEWRRLGFKNGFSTRSALVKFIAAGKVYLQKFYMPLPTPECGLNWRMYYRLIFFAPAHTFDLELMGGIWISRPGYKIYPEENALVGLVSPLTTTIFL